MKKNKEYYKIFSQKGNAQTQQQAEVKKGASIAKQSGQNVSGKPFKSSYINDSGKWSIKAVDDGYVDFDDYINDIKDESATYPSYNNKNFRVSDYGIKQRDNEYKEKKSREDGYTIKEAQEQEYASYNGWNELIWTVQDKASYVKDKTDETMEVAQNKLTYAKDKISNIFSKSEWAVPNLGVAAASAAYLYSFACDKKAEEKAKEWGLESAWNNKADAYRHFMWNAKMTRDGMVGYYKARNSANRHEYEYMQEENWIDANSEEFNHLKDNTLIKGRMNQECFMDLWNNQVGRELANNKDFKDKSTEDLFEYAIEHDLLITDATEAYEFLGILDYITDYDDYTVDVEWNLTTGNVTVKNENKSITLKLGI